MAFQSPSNFGNNGKSQYHDRAKTFQPSMLKSVGNDSGTTMLKCVGNDSGKNFIFERYFQTKEPANYANVPPATPDDLPFYPHNHHHHHPSFRAVSHHARSQSHSHHHYHTMRQDHNYTNNYSNIPSLVPVMTARSIRSPPNREKLEPVKLLNQWKKISEHPIDSCPPIPKTRDYTVFASPDGRFFKLGFPQPRLLNSNVTDPNRTEVVLPKNTEIMVLGPSQSDRSKFTVSYNDCCGQFRFDIHHHLTKMHRWN